jgi:hypothetical protein
MTIRTIPILTKSTTNCASQRRSREAGCAENPKGRIAWPLSASAARTLAACTHPRNCPRFWISTSCHSRSLGLLLLFLLTRFNHHTPTRRKPRLGLSNVGTRPFVVMPSAGSTWNAVIDQNQPGSTALCQVWWTSLELNRLKASCGYSQWTELMTVNEYRRHAADCIRKRRRVKR